jgi:hypothetical protein
VAAADDDDVEVLTRCLHAERLPQGTWSRKQKIRRLSRETGNPTMFHVKRAGSPDTAPAAFHVKHHEESTASSRM